MKLTSQTRSPLSSACRPVAAILIAVLLAMGSLPASAADMVWVGGDSENTSNFSNSGNWQNNLEPTWGSSKSLKFSQNVNSSVTGLNYNYGDWREAKDIFWDTTFPVSRTLSASNGGGIDFNTRIENNSSSTQTVTMNLSGGKFGASDIQLNPVKGNLILSGTIYNDNNIDYTVYGSDTATVTTLTLNTELGPISTNKANIDFTVAGGRTSAIQVNASQSWAGTTTVNSGSFITANGVTLASTAIVVGGGTVATTSANTLTDTASLTVNSGRLSIGGSDTVASLAGSGGTVDLASGATLTAGNAGSTSYAGSITGSGGFTKAGGGNLILSGSSTYSGATTVSAGRLSVNGSLGNTAVTVQSGGEVGGSGSIAGSLSVLAGGTLSPGNSIESLIAGEATFSGSSTFEYEYDSTNPASLAAAADLLVVNGNLTINSGAILTLTDLASSPNPFVNYTTIFALINYSGTWNSGLFTYNGTELTDGARFFVGGQEWQIDYNRTSATGLDNFTGDYLPSSSFVVITAVPEPSTAGLAAAGAAVAAWWMRGRRKRD